MDARMEPVSRQAPGPALLLKSTSLDLAIERMEQALMPGDLIFLDIPRLFQRQTVSAPDGWASHVGLCLKDSNGRWMVYEGAFPMVRCVELSRFVRQTRSRRFAVRRLRPAPQGELLFRLTREADKRLGNINLCAFNLDARELSASRLIREVFLSAVEVEIGQVVTLADLQPALGPSTLRFWQLWYLGFVPWQRRTVTPHSLYVDPQLDTVCESF